MKIFDWLRPGIKVKRWVMLLTLGVLLITMGVVEYIEYGRTYTNLWKMMYVSLIVTGIFIIYLSITQGMRSIIRLVNKGYLNVSKFF